MEHSCDIQENHFPFLKFLVSPYLPFILRGITKSLYLTGFFSADSSLSPFSMQIPMRGPFILNLTVLAPSEALRASRRKNPMDKTEFKELKKKLLSDQKNGYENDLEPSALDQPIKALRKRSALFHQCRDQDKNAYQAYRNIIEINHSFTTQIQNILMIVLYQK